MSSGKSLWHLSLLNSPRKLWLRLLLSWKLQSAQSICLRPCTLAVWPRKLRRHPLRMKKLILLVSFWKLQAHLLIVQKKKALR